MAFTSIEKILLMILYIMLCIGVYLYLSKKWKNKQNISSTIKPEKDIKEEQPIILDHQDLEPEENPFEEIADESDTFNQYEIDQPYQSEASKKISLEEKLKSYKSIDNKDIDSKIDDIIKN